jgi:hypothetical protein
VVAEAISEITELISEAVAQIVPILTQAVARAQQTMGESIVEAIPPCVGIAVEYALRIASKLAALLASGQNLLKLVQGALGVVDLIQQALSSISQQSTQPTPSTDPAAGTDSGNALGAADSGNTGPTAPMSTDGGAATPSGSTDSSGPADSSGPTDPAALANLGGSANLGSSTGADQLGVAAQSAAVVQPVQSTTPNAFPVHADASAGAVPGGAVPVGGMGLAAGARSGAGADTVRQDRRPSPPPTSTESNGVPLGGMGSARPAGEKDKEHKRKYTVVEEHDEVLDVVPPVIGEL